MTIYNAGSASVQIVPDFSGAQKDIGEWFARQGDLKVKIKPKIDDAALLETRAKLDAVTAGPHKVEVDEESLARSIGRGIDDALRSLSTVDVLNDAVKGAIAPSMISVLVGGLTELAASASQVIGLLYLMPALVMGLAAPLGVVLLGVSGVTSAFKVFSATTPAQLKQAQAALDKLAPSARNFVLQVHQLAPAFRGLKLDVQQQLFLGLGTAVRQLGEVAFPVMRTGLSGIAGDLNAGLVGVIHQLMSDGPAFTVLFENIGSAVRTIATGALPVLVQDFVQVAQLGSAFLPQLAAGFNTLVGRFDTFLQHAISTGQFVSIIEQAIQVVDVLGNIVGHLGSSITSIFTSAIPYGDELLGVLDKLTGELATFLKGPEAQDGLNTFFEDVNKVANSLLPVLLELVKVLVADVLPVIGDLAAAIAPVLAELGTQLAETVGAVTKMLPPLAEVIASLIEGMEPLIPVLGQIVTTLLPPLLAIGIQLGPVIDGLARAAAGILLQAAQALAPVLVQLGTAFLQMITAITPILPALGTLATSLLPPLLGIVVALLPPLTSMIQLFSGWATTLIHDLTPVIVGLVGVLNTVLVPVIKFLGPALPPLVAAFVGWQLAAGGLALVMNAIKWAQWIAFVVQYGIQVNLVEAATKAWTIAQGAWAVVTNLNVYARLAGALALYIVQVDLVKAATTAWAVVQGVLDALMSPMGLLIMAIVAAVAALAFGIYELVTHFGAVKAAAETVWNAIRTATEVAWQGIQNAISWAWNNVIQPVWNAIQTAASWMWNNVLSPIFSSIAASWNAMVGVMKWAWDNILSPTFTVIEDVAKVLAAILGILVFGPIAIAWKLMTLAIQFAWNDILKPVWNMVSAAANWLWNTVLSPVFSAIHTGWEIMVTAIQYAWNTVLKPTWDIISTVVQVMWNTVLRVVFDAIRAAWDYVAQSFVNAYNNWVKPCWDALETAANWLWNNVLSPVFRFIGDSWNNLMTGISIVYNTFVHPMWQIIKNALGEVQTAFTVATTIIGQVWEGVKKAVATPINFVINTILDHGLFAGWNWIVKTLGLPSSWDLHIDPIPGYADGGFTGAGMFGTGGKHDPAGVVHAGEFVVNQEQTARNLPLLMAINSGLPGYDGGGVVGTVKGWLGDVWNSATNVLGDLTNSITGPIGDLIKQFGDNPFMQMLASLPKKMAGGLWDKVKDQVGGFFTSLFSSGNPSGPGPQVTGVPSSRQGNENIVHGLANGYGWGGGDEWTALVDVIMRESGFNNVAQNPHSSAYGMFQFLDSTWGSWGVGKTSDPYQQTIAGLRYIESAYHDPLGALAHEQRFGWYDSGGYLPPGYSTVFNGTGRPEPVLTAAQNDALMRAAGFGPNGFTGRDGGVNVGGVNVAMQSANPWEVADEVVYRLRVAGRGGVYSTLGARQ